VPSTFTSLGSVTGRVRLVRRLDSMLEADVAGEIGTVRARLTTSSAPVGDGADARRPGLDLHAVRGRGRPPV
jgi:hypothetical protein